MIVGQNGNIERVLAPVMGQVDTEDEHIRANAKRLSQRLLCLKGHLTGEVKNCTSKVGQFHTLMEQTFHQLLGNLEQRNLAYKLN